MFVTFIALIASEFSGGTFRALLLRDPHRLRVIVGKLVGDPPRGRRHRRAVRGCSPSCCRSLVAPSQDISTTEWFSLASLGDGRRDYLTVLAGVAGWAIFGTTLAVIFRSAPLALGVGFAWAGPFENIVVDSWDTGFGCSPARCSAR